MQGGAGGRPGLPGVYWLWYLYSLTSTGEGTTRKSLRDMVTEWATTGKRSHRRPRPCRIKRVSQSSQTIDIEVCLTATVNVLDLKFGFHFIFELVKQFTSHLLSLLQRNIFRSR